MDVPIGPDTKIDKRRRNNSPNDSGDSDFSFAQSAPKLSIESQLKLRSLYEFVDTSQAALREIRADLSIFRSNPDDAVSLRRASERLNNFCVDADNWGFAALYKIGLALQRLLVDYKDRMCHRPFWEAFHKGLEMLSTLLAQCESGFRWDLAIDDMVDFLEPANLD